MPCSRLHNVQQQQHQRQRQEVLTTVIHAMANAQQWKDKENVGPLLRPVLHLDVWCTELTERLELRFEVGGLCVLQHQAQEINPRNGY